MKNGKKKLLVLLLMTLVLRLVFFVFYQPWDPAVEQQQVIFSDAKGYQHLAVEIMERHRFGKDPNSNLSAIRPPLYPLFAACVYSISGQRPWVVLMVQILLDTAACLFLFLAARQLFNNRVAWIAALFYALNPYQIQSCCILATEVLFMFFLLLSVFFFSKGLATDPETDKTGMLYYGLSGLCLGLATLAKPISQYLPLFIVLFFVFVSWRRWRQRRRKPQWIKTVKYALLFTTAFLIVLVPWLTRNYKTYGYVSLTTSASYNLLTLSAAPMEAVNRDKRLDIVKEEMILEANRMIRAEGKNPLQLNPFERAAYWRKVALRYIKNHPFRFLKTYVKGVVNIFIALGTSGFSDMLHFPGTGAGGGETKYSNRFEKLKGLLGGKRIGLLVTALFLVLYLFFVYCGAVIGVVKGWRKYSRESLVFLLLMVIYFILVTGVAGTVAARFKIPILPFLFILAGIGFEELRLRLRDKSA